MMRYKSTLSTLLTALVLTGFLAAPAGAQTPNLFAFLQLVHNIPDVGPVDVYVDDTRALDDFAFQNATPFFPLLCPNACKHKIDLVGGDQTDNSNPLFSADVVLRGGKYYGAYALGVLGAGAFEVLALDDLRLNALTGDKAEYLLIHGVPGAEVDIRLLDPDDPTMIQALLTNNMEFGDFVGYWPVDPEMQYFNVATSDGRTSLATLGFDFSGFAGKTLTVLASPLTDSTFTLVGFDSGGNKIEGQAPARALELPEMKTLAVAGNYPNPFNPTTSIRFDLMETARVSLEVVDMLGRTVMTLPDQHFEAGVGHALQIDGSALASGLYLYRLTARTDARTLLTHTGRMILSK